MRTSNIKWLQSSLAEVKVYYLLRKILRTAFLIRMLCGRKMCSSDFCYFLMPRLIIALYLSSDYCQNGLYKKINYFLSQTEQ